jgi:hypothetical protein
MVYDTMVPYHGICMGCWWQVEKRSNVAYRLPAAKMSEAASDVAITHTVADLPHVRGTARCNEARNDGNNMDAGILVCR